MSWKNNLYRMCRYYPTYYGDWAYSHLDVEIYANNSLTITMSPAYTGTLTFQGFIIDGTSRTLRECVVTDSFRFDISTGYPTYNIGSGNIVTINCLKNKIYYCTVKGNTDSTTTLRIAFSGTVQASISTKDAITNYEGLLTQYCTDTSDITVRTPITFKYSCEFGVIPSVWTAGNIFTLKRIENGSEVEVSRHHTSSNDEHGVTWMVEAGYQYYLYYIGFSEWLYSILDVEQRILVLTTSGDPNYLHSTISIFGTFKRDVESTTSYGSVKYQINRSGLDYYWGSYGYLYNRSLYHAPIFICWVPPLLTGTESYKWIKFEGWYTDDTYEHLITRSPWMIYTCLTVGTNHVYGKVSFLYDDFEWTTTPVSGLQFNISALEWDTFVTYAYLKYSKHVTQYTDNWSWFSVNDYYDTYVKSVFSCCRNKGYMLNTNKYFMSWAFNNVKNLLDRFTTELLPTSDVASGDIIYASYINNILTEAKAL